jgi:colanic acid/amylovoran biosynthesis glycosyltransferase
MSVAYLVNQYPKVSHTFIRREIAALERLGLTVRRFSIRPCPDRLDDPEDQAELSRTEVLLEAHPFRMLAAVARQAFGDPARTTSALALSLRLGRRSERGTLRHLAYFVEACVLRRALTEQGCRHLHAHFGTNSATVAMLCHELGGPAWSFTVHGPEEFDKSGLIGLTEKIRRAGFVVAISSYGRSQLLRLADASDWSKIHVVPCGLDAHFLAAERPPASERRRLVCVGRLSEQKGHPILIEAAEKLRARGVDFELVLVGDGELRQPIEARILHEGLGDRIRITGWVDGHGVRAELAAARALVLPSFAEGLPVVIMEALALGRPVVSTFVAGIPELVEPGKNGWLVPAGSADELARALEVVLSTSADELRVMGDHGRARVAERHDVARSAASLMSLMGGPGL